MQNITLRIGALLGVCAVCAMATGVADAMPPSTLSLQAQSTELAAGALVNVEVHFGNCAQAASAVLESDGDPQDALAIDKAKRARCGEGEVSKLSGRVSEVELSNTLHEVLAGSLKATVNGCAYRYTSFEGRVTENPGLAVEGSGTGTLTKAPRGASCEPTHQLAFRTLLTSAATPIFAAVHVSGEWNIEAP